jgi:hypothetical protein
MGSDGAPPSRVSSKLTRYRKIAGVEDRVDFRHRVRMSGRGAKTEIVRDICRNYSDELEQSHKFHFIFLSVVD